MANILLRNMMYVPAFKEKFIDKSLDAPADALIYDLEDSVPQSCKAEARVILKSYIEKGVFAGKKVFVRLNPLESFEVLDDLEAVVNKDIFGFVPTKIYSADDIKFYDELLNQLEVKNEITVGHFKLAPLIETAQAVAEINEIAKASERIVAVLFGGEDFLNDMMGTHGEPPKAFDYPRAQVAVAARSAGVQAIDTPFLAVHDIDAFIAEEMLSKDLGFSGIQVLSPRQIEPANKCFTPSEEEVNRSREIVAAWKESIKTGSGVAMFNGKMIGPPMRKRAEKILEIMELVEDND